VQHRRYFSPGTRGCFEMLVAEQLEFGGRKARSNGRAGVEDRHRSSTLS
jgi:hypothetical protein